MHVMNPQKAIEALQANGWSETDIATDVGVYQSTINRIRKGMPPSWELGQKIIACAMDNVPMPKSSSKK
jgi:DNA-binding XRE family transcriptional regulator